MTPNLALAAPGAVPAADTLVLVDWPLLILFIGLFVLIEGFRVSGGMAAVTGLLAEWKLDLHAPAILAPVSVVLSNVVSNVPAVMLIARLVPVDEEWMLSGPTSVLQPAEREVAYR